MTDNPPQETASGAARLGSHRAQPGSTIGRLRRPLRPHNLLQSRRWSILVLTYLGVAFYLAGWVFPKAFRAVPELNFYFTQPILWSALGLVAGIGWRRLSQRPPFHWSLVRAGLMVGLFHVSVLVIAGVFAGFGRSGVGDKLINYPLNALYVGTMLAGLEMTRAYLYSVWKERSERAAFAVVTVVIFIASTPVNRFFSLDDLDRFFRIGGGSLAPALVVSGVATWMVSRSGPGPAIAYQGALLALEWLSPFLPALSWVPLLLVGTVTPLVALLLFRGLGEDALPRPPARAEEATAGSRNWLRWVTTAAIVAVLVGFFSGTFGVRPFVISGISMEPALQAGDLAIVQQGLDPASLRSGDIIKYHRGPLPVVHRVVSVESETDGVVVITKGDNVLTSDPPVSGAVIEGKVVFAIPWIGRITLWLGGE